MQTDATNSSLVSEQGSVESQPLSVQFRDAWPRIFLGIVLAGACYPTVVAAIMAVYAVFEGAGTGSPGDFVSIVFVMIPVLLMAGGVGLILAGAVSALVLPAIYFVLHSLQTRGSIVWLGAFCGGLVGFLSVMAILLGVLDFVDLRNSQELWPSLAIGPALTTVMGQLGGAWGGRRAVLNMSGHERAITQAVVQDNVDEIPGSVHPRPDTRSPVAPPIQFGVRHLLWVSVWFSVLLSLIRLSGIPFDLSLPLLIGWIVYQTATLFGGAWLLPRVAEWREERKQRFEEVPNPTAGV